MLREFIQEWIKKSYCGCVRGTSTIKSGGYSKSSGLKEKWRLFKHILWKNHYSCPFAESTRGRMSNSVRGLLQPIFKQTCWSKSHVGNASNKSINYTSVMSTFIGSPVMDPSGFT